MTQVYIMEYFVARQTITNYVREVVTCMGIIVNNSWIPLIYIMVEVSASSHLTIVSKV